MLVEPEWEGETKKKKHHRFFDCFQITFAKGSTFSSFENGFALFCVCRFCFENAFVSCASMSTLMSMLMLIRMMRF
eukprot:COSAG06_NODE_167_length_21546_cov_35.001352_29_plen_76_part_00